jgi:hypothetical protein
MIAIAFVHNLLRRHPSCTVLLHRSSPSAPTAASHARGQQTGDEAAAEPVQAPSTPSQEHRTENGAASINTEEQAVRQRSHTSQDANHRSGAEAGQWAGAAGHVDSEQGQQSHRSASHAPAAGANPEAAPAAGPGSGQAAAVNGGSGHTESSTGRGKGASLQPGEDPYLEDEGDPAQSRAVESSLWEMETLRNHYCPQVR